jgi:hypothetical protein
MIYGQKFDFFSKNGHLTPPGELTNNQIAVFVHEF